MEIIYADLVEFGYRTLDPEKEPDKIAVPDIIFNGMNLREAVRKELERRKGLIK